MGLDNLIKYQRIGSKFLEGIARIIIGVIIFLVIQYFIHGNLDLRDGLVSFGGIMFIILTIAIIDETIDYNQKYYEILSNKNYLRVRQFEELDFIVKDKSNFLDKIERQVFEKKDNWLLSEKKEDRLEFQTKKKSLLNWLIEDKIIIRIEKTNRIVIESSPINKIVFLDSSRNFGNILFVKSVIKKSSS